MNIARSWTAAREAIGEVGGFSLTVRDDLRLYLIQTAEKGMAWLDLDCRRSGRARFARVTSRTRSPSSARRLPRIGSYDWPRKITDPQRAFLEALAEASRS